MHCVISTQNAVGSGGWDHEVNLKPHVVGQPYDYGMPGVPIHCVTWTKDVEGKRGVRSFQKLTDMRTNLQPCAIMHCVIWMRDVECKGGARSNLKQVRQRQKALITHMTAPKANILHLPVPS
jgi:hypothetical protein